MNNDNLNRGKWKRVSRQHSCPICGKPDWCMYAGPDGSPDAAICARIESDRMVGSEGSGWLHRLRDDDQWRRAPRARRGKIDEPTKPMPTVEFLESMAAEFVLALDRDRERQISESLGVTWRSLNRLQMGWSNWHQSFSFPMRGSDGNPRGIRFRARDGRKWSLRGGREGLFLPINAETTGTLLICEGPTDCAALLDLRFSAVGRPSCAGGVQLIVDLVCDWHPEKVVVFADADPPGQRGARYLASRLVGYVPDGVRIVTPPAKDAREWVRSGATCNDVLELIDAAPRMQLTYGVKAVSA